MRSITFTADDRRSLAHDRFHHPDPPGLPPTHRPTLPRRVPRRRPDSPAPLPLASAPERPGRAPGIAAGVLLEAPGPFRQAGPGRHRAADRRPPGPQPGPPLPQGPAGAALAQDQRDPRPAPEDDPG